MTKLFTIAAFNLAVFFDRLDRLNRIAESLGCEAVIADVVRTYTDVESRRELAEIALTYSQIRYNGWELVAHIDRTDVLIVESFASDVAARDYADVDATRCDHCNIAHRRNHTYVVRNEEKVLCVGGSCVKHYTGHDVTKITAFVEAARDLENEESYGPGAPQFYRTDYVLALACHASTDADSHADAVRVLIQDRYRPSASNITMARDVAEWVALQSDSNDYFFNLKNALDAGEVTWRHIGLVASAVRAYTGYKAREATSKPSVHVGTPKARLRARKVTCNRVMAFEGYYGVTFLVLMNDEDGNSLVWRTSNPVVDAGETVLCDFTVKAHDDYKGRPQTVVTRLKVKEVIKAA